MATFISHSLADTLALGESWGRAAQAGSVFVLYGELGAGKTQLVKGLARGLDISARVHSPTFALINVYEGGRCPLFHLDLYRLRDREEVIAAGLEDYLLPAGVAAVEWGERYFGVAPLERSGCSARWLRQVWIESPTEQERRIVYEDIGA